MRINDATIYLTDNGAAYCGAHLGSSAKQTGRDISGQKIIAITPEVAALSMIQYGPYVCEQCGLAASVEG